MKGKRIWSEGSQDALTSVTVPPHPQVMILNEGVKERDLVRRGASAMSGGRDSRFGDNLRPDDKLSGKEDRKGPRGRDGEFRREHLQSRGGRRESGVMPSLCSWDSCVYRHSLCLQMPNFQNKSRVPSYQ